MSIPDLRTNGGKRDISAIRGEAAANEVKTEFSKAEQGCRAASLKSSRERNAKANRAKTKRLSPKQVVKDLTYIKEANSEKILRCQKRGTRN